MKPLTKDDLFAHDIGLIVKCDDWEKTGNQILENQEKAEKWNEFTKALDNPNSEHPLWIQSLEAMKIVERVKKRIEVLTVEIDMLTEKFKTCDTDETLKLIDLRNELQKIVERKK